MCSFLFNLNNGRSEGVASASQGSFWGCRERLRLASKHRAFLTARKQAAGEATRLNRMVQSHWPLGLRRLQLGDVLRVCPGASAGGESAGSHRGPLTWEGWGALKVDASPELPCLFSEGL